MNEPIPASKKRLVLAAYLDLLLVSMTWGIVIYLSGGNETLATLTLWIIFTPVIGILFSRIISPGRYLLSIYLLPGGMPNESDERSGPPARLAVDPDIFKKESWITMLFGTLFILSGTKSIVRWMLGTPPLPLFGFQISPAAFNSISILLGILSVYLGYCFLKLRKWAVPLVLAMSALLILSTVMSWELWAASVQELVIQRRESQGLPIREGEIAFMQTAARWMMLGFGGLAFSVTLFSRKRFK